MSGEFQSMFQYAIGDECEPGPSFVPPAWLGPPSDELGWAVALSLVVARSEQAVVALRQANAYSTGVVFDVVSQARGLSPREAHNLMHEQHVYPHDEEPAPGFLRVGVELADGARASNLGTRRPPPTIDKEPEGPVLMQIGGGGGSADEGSATFDERYWLWPLPPSGSIRIYVEWPRFGIDLSPAEIDSGVLLDAARRSRNLWAAP